LIAAVKDNPVLWDCRHDVYKLSENKPLVWAKIADQLKCAKSKCIRRLNYKRSLHRLHELNEFSLKNKLEFIDIACELSAAVLSTHNGCSKQELVASEGSYWKKNFEQ
jgi:hypothetical protein